MLHKVQERARGIFARDYGHALRQMDQLELSFNLKMMSRQHLSLVERTTLGCSCPGHEIWVAELSISPDSIADAERLPELFSQNALHARKRRGSQVSPGRAAGARHRVHVKLCAPGNRSVEAKAALLIEARLLHCLGRHPNVLDLQGAVTVGDPLMIVTPYMAGGTLQMFLKRAGPLTLEEKYSVIAKVSSAMAYLESLSIVHRALCLDAVAVGHSIEEIRLTNFGGLPLFCICGSEKMAICFFVRLCSICSTSDCFLLPCLDMARDIYQTGAYREAEGGTVTKARTWALESLEDDVFSVKSDVWSYAM